MAFSRKKTISDAAVKPEKLSRKKSVPSAPSKVAVSKSKSKRFVMIIGDEGCILVYLQGSKVVRRLFAPSANPSHSEAMIELMKANPKDPLYILMDVMDQQYVPQAFPPVSSLSVSGLVKRRLDRDFQPDDFKSSLPMGRDKAGRKEWRYLLIALAKTPLVNDWVENVINLPNELKGIYLVPVEAASYIARLSKELSDGKASSWKLLFSHNKVSGFRQVVMRDNKLVFTRVSQAIDDAIPAVIAGNIEQEIINTMEYLKRLDFRDNAELDATVIVSQDVIESLDLKRFGFAQAHAITPLDVSQRLGLEQAALSADRFGDVVMAAAFGTQKKQALRLSNAYIDKLAKFYKARIAIVAGAALCVLALLVLCGSSIAGMVESFSAIDQAKSKARAIQSDLEKLKKSVDGLNTNVAYKSAVVAAYDAYIKDASTPESFVASMAPLVTPQARVVLLSWEDKTTATKVGSATAAAPSAGSLPISVIMEVDFAGAGTTLEAIDPAAKSYAAMLAEKLSQYDIKADPFPWSQQANAGDSVSTEIDLNAANVITVSDTKVKFTLSGIKKIDASATPVASPQAPPAVGVTP